MVVSNVGWALAQQARVALHYHKGIVVFCTVVGPRPNLRLDFVDRT